MEGLRSSIRRVVEQGAVLSETEAHDTLSDILDGSHDDAQIAALLTAMATRGEAVSELVGFVRAMRERMLPLPLHEGERAQLVDTCGTGGDGACTFNISTGAALVAAAAGAKVAKHGNRALTSRCGSADVLEALGVAVHQSPEDAVASLRETGFSFLFAPSSHPAMRRVQAVRRALPFRTIFNLAGPLTNPAGASAQVVGVFAAGRVAVVAETMASVGTRYGLVVHGSDGLDELTVTGESTMAVVKSGKVEYRTVHPSQLGFGIAPRGALQGGSTAAASADMLLSIFRGEVGPRRDVVVMNAAAALMAAGVASGLESGVELAAAAIDSGAVLSTLGRLRSLATATKR